MNPADPNRYKKGAWIVGAILLTASISGYFMGLRQTGSQISLTRPVSLVSPGGDRHISPSSGTVPVAVAYAQQDWLRDGPNGRWQNRLGNLAPPASASPILLTNVTDEQRNEALLARRARRAFDGAPPVVPHPIAQESSAACVACHGPGLVVKDKVASRISHALYPNCTQCHVPSGGTELPTQEAPLLAAIADNQFAGASAPQKGSRAWPTAPPSIPHASFMRSDCLSCHGPHGLFGLRTPHPERQSCLQCHAADASLDQRNFSARAEPAPVRPAGKAIVINR